MNLHNIAVGYVAAINPIIVGQYQQSTGSTIGPNFKPVPTYAAAVPVQCQIQALTYKDLMQLSGINLNGEARAMYVNGNFEGVARPDGRGGDLITLPDNSVWLVTHVLENWAYMDGWTKFAVVKQNGS